MSPGSLDAVRDLERRLGDPARAGSAISWKGAVRLDEAERFPEAACRALESWGLQRYYVPAALGGRLLSFEEAVHLTRAVARRDMTAAVGHCKTFLGAAPVWAAGAPSQRRDLARRVLRGERVSLALTERAHGGDLAASDTLAVEAGGGYALTGEKWLINNARRGRHVSLLARHRGETGPLSCSLFLLDKSRAPSGALSLLPKQATHGIRGADISGLRLRRWPVGPERLVGPRGRGLETLLKALQVTRLLCAGLSLGAGDTALRCALGFSLRRRLYGRAVFELAPARGLLTGAFLDLLAAECLTLAAARSLQAFPGRMSLPAAAVKYLAPTLVEDAVRDLSVVLGARFYLRAESDGGIFQKLLRDNAVVGLFDGSTAVNLETVASQLPQAARGRRARAAAGAGRALFSLGRPLPELDWRELSLSSRGEESIAGSAEQTLARLERGGGRSEGARAARRAAAALVQALRRHDARASRSSSPEERADSARRECRLQAAAACLGVLAWSRPALSPELRGGGWAALCAERLLGERRLPSGPLALEAAQALETMWREGRAFSVLPLGLAEARS